MFTFTWAQCISLFNSIRVRGLLAALAFFICLSAAQSIPAQSALDGFNPNLNSSAYEILVQPDGKILIGGNFTSVSGVTRNHIARLNPDGSLDTAFDPNASGRHIINGSSSRWQNSGGRRIHDHRRADAQLYRADSMPSPDLPIRLTRVRTTKFFQSPFNQMARS